jgi:hypothetical protein
MATSISKYRPSISKLHIVPDIEAKTLTFDIEGLVFDIVHISISGIFASISKLGKVPDVARLRLIGSDSLREMKCGCESAQTCLYSVRTYIIIYASVCTIHIQRLGYECINMYVTVHLYKCMYMYITCTYMFMRVCNFVNMYIHVCTMFRHVCTVLPILQVVQVVRLGVSLEFKFQM